MLNNKLGLLHDPEHLLGMSLFPVTQIIEAKLLRSQTWNSPLTLNQGETPACTGFSCATNLATQPIPEQNVSNEVGLKIYETAQNLDPWAGTPHKGSTVTAAMKAVRTLYPGIFDCYRWSKTLHNTIYSIGYLGPVIMGTDWFNSMFNVDKATNTIHVDINSGLAGGHAWMIYGVDIEEKVFKLHNSWGNSWGINGKALIKFDDLEMLLKRPYAQCLVPLGKHQRNIS